MIVSFAPWVDDLGLGGPSHYAAEQSLLARSLAVVAHAGQMRAGAPAERYFEHVRRVAANFVPGPERCVGYLHDVLEDTFVTRLDLLEAGVDRRVVDAVEALTHEHGIGHAGYLEHIRALKDDPLARAVKIADLTDNLSAPERLERVGWGPLAKRLGRRYAAALEILADG